MKTINVEKPNFKYSPYVLYACDKEIRFKGSAGGVATQLIKYMFDKNYISSALTFKFAGENLYIPKIARSFEEYNITGSIYHEIDIFSFLKENIKNFTDHFAITALPCQVKAIRKIAERHNKNVIIISLTCSAQQEKEATYYLLEYLGIDSSDVELLKYRGNGWPSGIFIRTKDGKEYKIENINSIWMYIFHSMIFSLDRCITCKDTFGIESDIILADPWLKRYKEKEKIGASITIPNSEIGNLLIEKAIDDKYLCVNEKITIQEVIESQYLTLEKKYIQRKYRKFFKFLKSIFKYFPYLHFKMLSILYHKILFKMVGEDGNTDNKSTYFK